MVCWTHSTIKKYVGQSKEDTWWQRAWMPVTRHALVALDEQCITYSLKRVELWRSHYQTEQAGESNKKNERKNRNICLIRQLNKPTYVGNDRWLTKLQLLIKIGEASPLWYVTQRQTPIFSWVSYVVEKWILKHSVLEEDLTRTAFRWSARTLKMAAFFC